MGAALTQRVLQRETLALQGTGGVSANNRHRGFRPAFKDASTNVVYLSCYRDGRAAPLHLLEGLPEEIVVARTASGEVEAVKPTVVSGFVRDGFFYTREEAAEMV
jgi:hypothetical protein